MSAINNPTNITSVLQEHRVFRPAKEFSKRARTENAFVTRVLEQPKLWVIGSENDLPIAA